MAEDSRRTIRLDRLLIVILAVLLLLALVYIVVDLVAGLGKGRLPAEPALTQTLASPMPPTETASLPPTEAPMIATEGVAAAEVTPTPRRLELPPTPTPFAVMDEEDPRAILDLDNPDHFDYFEDPDAWYDYDTAGFAAYHVENGRLIGVDYDPANLGVYWSYNSVQSGNVYAEITAINGDCIAKDAVGLVIRIDPEQTPSGYALEVSCDGAWRFLRYHPGGAPTAVLIDWSPTDVIRTGPFAQNRLGLWGYQGKFHFLINGFHVGEYFDPNYTHSFGYFAAYVRASQTFDLRAEFDDFAFWHIKFIP